MVICLLEPSGAYEKEAKGRRGRIFPHVQESSHPLLNLMITLRQLFSSNSPLYTSMNSGANLDQRGNILKEVSIMRQLNHPNISSLLEFQESRDYYFLVLELASGGELFHQIVRLTYFSEDLSRHVILQVAKGIRYLHEEKGVVHRYQSLPPFLALSNRFVQRYKTGKPPL
jgi:serine/threonine protein kinase